MKKYPLFGLVRCGRGFATAAAIGFLQAAPEAQANFLSYIGGSGNWSDPANWSPTGIPQNGDDLQFNNSAGANTTNDIPSLSLRSIEFRKSGTIWGASFTITSGLNALSPDDGPLALSIPFLSLGGDTSFSCNNGTGWGLTLNCTILLNGFAVTANSLNSGSVIFRAPVTGSGRINFTAGNNYLDFATGSSGLAPVRLQGGTLGLSAHGTVAIGSALEIDSGAVAVLNADSQIDDTATVTILGGGQLLLNGHTDAIGSLVLTNYSGDTFPCTVDASGQGLLGFTGGITSWNDSGSVVPVISGRVTLNGFIPIFAGGSAYAGLDLPAALGSAGGFSKAGNSALLLHGNSTFTGGVEVDQGILDVNHVNALGAASGGVLLSGGSLTLRTSISGETLTAGGHEQITGEFAGSLLTAQGNSALSWIGPVVLTTNLVVAGGNINFIGPITGPGGLIFLNTGTSQLSGSGANSYTGTTLVRCFLLEFNKPSGVNAYAGPLAIGGGGGGPYEARWLNSYQNVGADLTLYANGVINLNNNNEDFGPVTFNGGEVDTGTGQFTIYAPLTVNPSATPAVINGNLGLPPGADRVFNVGDGAADPDLLVNAVVFGSPGTYFVKQGAGTMVLANANTYNAPTLLEQGILDINNGSGLGTWPGLIIFDGATLRVSGSDTTGGGVELLGTGVGGTHGAIEVLPGYSFTTSGGILLDGPTTCNIGALGGLGFGGSIVGTGPLTKIGPGFMNFTGAGNNSYSGDTIVLEGALNLTKNPPVIAVPHNLVIGPASASSPAVARLYQTGGLVGPTVTVNASSLFDLNGYSQSLTTLNLRDGGSVQTRNGLLDFPNGGAINVGSVNPLIGSHVSSSIMGAIGLPANATLSFNINAYAPFPPFASGPELDVLATIPRPVEDLGFAPAGITKNGLGQMRLSANNAYAGSTLINGGTLTVDGTQPQSLVSVNSGTLGGTGTVGDLYMSGSGAVVAPGDGGPGILTCGNVNPGITANGTLRLELNGTTAGSGYDQLNVVGTVNLAGVALQPSLGFAAPTGSQFVLISNDGRDFVNGTFNGLAEGGKLYIGGALYQITYQFTGRLGNDVALQALVTPPPPTLTIQRVPPDSVRLLWPVSDPPFSLQNTTNLTAATWTNALPLPTVVGTNDVVTNAIADAQRFYRLSNP